MSYTDSKKKHNSKTTATTVKRKTQSIEHVIGFKVSIILKPKIGSLFSCLVLYQLLLQNQLHTRGQQEVL